MDYIEMIKRMMRERAEYYFDNSKGQKDISAAMAYDTCANLIEYALVGNLEAIQQYDYFHKED